MQNHFTYDEISCNCGCGFSAVESGVLVWMNAVRNYRGKSTRATSVCRCPDWNSKHGGAKRSQHLPRMAESAERFYQNETHITVERVMASTAADLKIPTAEQAGVVEFTREFFPDISLGIYMWGLHGDNRTVRGERRRQWGSL